MADATMTARATLLRKATVALVVSGLAILATAGPAAAHESEEGIVAVVDDQRVIVTAAVAFDQLGYTDTSGDGRLDVDELAAQRTAVAASLVDRARDSTSLTVDGERLDVIGAGVPALSEPGNESGASTHVVLVLASAPHDGDVSDLELAWSFDSPSKSVVLSNADGIVTGDLGDDGVVTFSLSTWSSIGSFFQLGIEHIQYGPDHLLFLLVLTLAATGTTITATTTRRVVKLVTAFTVGHALSLTLAYFDAALLALRGQVSEAGPWLAGLVGVVHGLGFASNLSTLGVAASQRIAALAAFNLGVDVAQTAVVFIVIAALWTGGNVLADRVTWVRFAGAAGAAMFGLAWTAGRLVELSA